MNQKVLRPQNYSSNVIQWKKPPQGLQGEGEVLNEKGEWVLVHWKKDKDGIWLVFPEKSRGYNFQSIEDDHSNKTFYISSRLLFKEEMVPQGSSSKEILNFKNSGKQNSSSIVKKIKVRSQMPGKVIRLKIRLNDFVEKGQSLLVMEAMKMENEIIAPLSGKITQIECQENVTIEAGVILLWIDPS